MGVLSIDRRICAELLDARGNVVVHGGRGGAALLRGTLHEVPARFRRGSPLSLTILVGESRFDVATRIVEEQPALPGAQIYLEVLKAGPADISQIEAFDLVPLTDTQGRARPPTPPFGTPFGASQPFGNPFASPPRGTPFATSLPPDSAAFQDEEPTGIVGTLKEMPVVEVVQSLQQNHKDALVDVKSKDREPGTLGVVAGRVVYARTATKVGEAALFELLAATRGAFRIRYGRAPDATNIVRDTSFLLIEGLRVMDEERERGAAPVVVDEPPAPVPAPASVSPSGRFARFFDEAGVQTPAPLEPELADGMQRFSSLTVRSIESAFGDDTDDADTDVTHVERPRPRRVASEHSDPTHP